MLLSDASGAIRIYDPFTTEAHGDGETAETTLENTDSTVSSSGKWLFTFTTSYTCNSGATPRRKKVLDAVWILNGTAILALLEDGEWCIYSLNPEAHPNTNPVDPVLRGYLGAASDTTRQPKTTASRLAPMTPNTRQAKAETFFASHPKAAGAAPQGGLAVVTSSLRAGQEDESVILWYNGEIYSIPSLQTFYQRSTTNKNGGSSGLGSLYAPGLTHITDMNLMNESITSIAQEWTMGSFSSSCSEKSSGSEAFVDLDFLPRSLVGMEVDRDGDLIAAGSGAWPRGASSSDAPSSYTLTELSSVWSARNVEVNVDPRAPTAGVGETGDCGLGGNIAGGLDANCGADTILLFVGDSIAHGDLDPIEGGSRDPPFGHKSNTRVSCTSTIIDAIGLSETKHSPLASATISPRQCTLAPFHPRHSTSTFPPGCSASAAW